MEEITQLSEKNYLLYAAKNYCNPVADDVREFKEDLARVVYIKRLLKRYQTSGTFRARLVLNHIIIFYNVFGREAATRLLFFGIDEGMLPELKTVLIHLRYIQSVGRTPEVDYTHIEICDETMAKLKKLGKE